MNRVAHVPLREKEPKRSLSAQRRRQLEDIASKERLRSAREKLAHIFVEKFCVKYGKRYKYLIQEEVRRFIMEKDEITPDDISRLDQILIESIKRKKNNSEHNLLNMENDNEQSDNLKELLAHTN